MPKTRSPSVLGSGRVLYLPTARIRPNPMQPRKHFDTGGLQELAGSIRQYGVLQPLTVRKAGGAYELVAGERRLRAARLAGLTEVPCLLADVDEEASGMLALVENLQRRDLDYIEEAEGLQKLMQQYHLSQEQAARRIGLAPELVKDLPVPHNGPVVVLLAPGTGREVLQPFPVHPQVVGLARRKARRPQAGRFA